VRATFGYTTTVYLSLGKAARTLGVSPATVRRWTASGFLPCVRTAGGHRRIESDDVAELARAIGDSSHLEARRAREREVETLVQASLDMASRLDQTELLAEIARHVTALCRCHTCEIMEYLPDEQAVRVLAEYDAKGRRWSTSGVFDLSAFPATRRVLDGQAAMTVNIDDRGADAAEVALMRRYGEKSVLMLPLVFQGDTIGLLEACDRAQSRRYTAQELRLCRALAGQAAVALHNARLFGSVRVAEAETALLRERLNRLAAAFSDMPDLRVAQQAMPALCEAARAAFEAHSCVIARRGRVLGAAVAAEQTAASRGTDRRAFVACDPHGVVEVTLVANLPATPGQTELLKLVASIAARLTAE
jgi:excisionase family DNA binding protein